MRTSFSLGYRTLHHVRNSDYHHTKPPSTMRSIPVTKDAALLDRKMAGPATSSGVVILCKGVSAALIMVEVATIFISFFRDWVKRKEDIDLIKDPKEKLKAAKELDRIDSLVYTINDMVDPM